MALKAIVVANSYDIFALFLRSNQYSYRDYRWTRTYFELFSFDRETPVILIVGHVPPRTRTDEFYLNRMRNKTDWSFGELKGKKANEQEDNQVGSQAVH